MTTDAYDPRTTDEMSLASVSWYSQVLRGAGTRIASYKQYDAMDTDVDISRSLDIIAEEMSGKDDKTGLPFEIVYQKEDNQDISDTTAITLRQAVRQWGSIQSLDRRIFSIARALVKYGDCFFRKFSDTKRWEYVDCSRVHGIEVDQFGGIVSYHIKAKSLATKDGFGVRNEQIEVVPAAAMIHFTMSDDMGDSAPFGQSVLKSIHRVYRQLCMIEDAVIIYRIVRAPERRVFYVDVGNMPPQRVKIYLEQIKNELRQKHVPGMSTSGKEVVDGQLDATSMSSDYFFPVTAAGRGSRVETLPGGTEDFGTNLLKYFQDKIFRGLRIPTSYMSGQDGAQAQYNDGKVGIAYIEEMRFAQFIMRLQDRIESVMDQEFKVYMKVVGLNVDDEIFKLKLPDPANFALYRQAALDADLISAYNNIANDKTLATRFKQKRYLGLTDDEMQMNEVLIKEERGITENDSISPLRQIYDDAIYSNRETITVDSGEDTSDTSSMGGEESGFFSDSEPVNSPETPEATPPEAPEQT